MGTPSARPSPSRTESWLALAAFALCLVCHFRAAMVGWQSKNLPGVEYRQAQTALSAYFINADDNFSLAYPTPVLGKPWSIPLEFPLYQWTVVEVSRATHLGLIKSGRIVSLACFYLMLPAIFLLLARWNVAPGHRWLVLAVVVTCPLYVFYARGFLIETMALMFAVWFWLAFERAVSNRSVPWLAVATIAGTGAGLVKVTTFMLYLLPAACWAMARLWRERGSGRWRGDVAWMAAAVAIPLGVTWWWLRFSDAVKSLNPAARFLRSDAMAGFTLGAPATRFSAELWAMKGRIIVEQLSWFPLLVGCAALALLGARQRWREIAYCVGLFVAALLVFPILYAYHEYYYLANTVLLMVAVGLVVVALAESSRPRWVPVLAVVLIAAGQAYAYFERYYPEQRGVSLGGDGLSQSLHALTAPDEVIIVTGQDWNSMTAFYAQRRALMLRADTEQNPAQLDAALANLAGDKIGALALATPVAGKERLVQRLVARGLEPTPFYFWRTMAIYLPTGRREEFARKLDELGIPEVRFAPGAEPKYPTTADGWYNLATLPAGQHRMFEGMQPQPVRFFSLFGIGLNRSGGRMDFGAHPVTRLVFALPAGHHVLKTSVEFSPEAYRADLPDADATDGVEITLAALGADEARRVLNTRILDPRRRPEDRGRQPLRIAFDLEQAGEVELFVSPGPNGRDTRDWVVLGRLEIE